MHSPPAGAIALSLGCGVDGGPKQIATLGHDPTHVDAYPEGQKRRPGFVAQILLNRECASDSVTSIKELRQHAVPCRIEYPPGMPRYRRVDDPSARTECAECQRLIVRDRIAVADGISRKDGDRFAA